MYRYCWKKTDGSHSWESISVGLLGWKGVYFVCLFSSPFSKETPQGIVGLFKDRTASWWSRLSWFAFPSTFSLYSLNICVIWFDLFAGSFLRRLNLLRLRWNTCQHLCLSLEITQFPVLQKTSPSGSVSAIVIQRISPIIHLVCPLTFCITGPFFFISPAGYYSSREKLKSMLMQTFGGQTACITGDVQRRTSYLITVCVE